MTTATPNPTHDEQTAARDNALNQLGFSPAWPSSEWGPWFTTCRTCGAAVVLTPDPTDSPIVIHHEWHATNTPAGRVR